MEFGWFGTLGVGALGAVVGSFLNVVICRLPRGQSLVRPGSRCPHCGAGVRPQHNVPVLGYLWLRGRCRDCRAPISARYPAVEALMALLAAGAWLRFGPTAAFGAHFLLFAGLLAVTFIDFDHRIIPDSLSLGGVAVGFAVSFATPLGWQGSLLGAAVGGGSLLAVALGYYAVTRREGMGLGDVKLLAAIGAFLGWPAVLFTIFASSVVGALVGLGLAALGGGGLKLELPFGPFLALGAVTYAFCGPELVTWYLGALG